MSEPSDLFAALEASIAAANSHVGETPSQAAARFASAGMRVFPVDMRLDPNGQPSKLPPYGYRWKQRATTVLAEVIEDFTNAEHDLGIDNVAIAWALGQDGKLACDLDTVGPTWWPMLGDTAVNVTKRGEHLIFAMPAGRRIGNGTSRFPSEGWGEVRGDGGYIIIWWSDRPGFDVAELERIVVFPKPEWLTDAGADAEAVSFAELDAFIANHTAGSLGPINGFTTTLARRAKGASRHHHAVPVACWIAREAAAGLVPAAEAFGALEDWWTAVAKTPEWDTKGRLKTRRLSRRELRSIECWAIGQLTEERIAETLAKAEAEAAAYRAERQAEEEELNRLLTSGTAYVPPPGVDAATGEVKTPSDLNLPAEFWNERPVLAHIRQAAWSRMVSPDALLANAIARTATLIPPTYTLPAVIGAEATVDYIAAVIADTSGGKTIAHGVAKSMLPCPEWEPGDENPIMMDLSIGSGEGIVEAFMVDEPPTLDANSKLRSSGRRVVGRQALHLVVDEGTAFVNQAQRNGTTVVATLVSAWSGAALGALNASKETRRIISAGRVRVTAVINMQAENGYMLFSKELESVGFTGRILFASAHDPSAPEHDLPDWPGELHWPAPGTPEQITRRFVYDPAIEADIRGARHGVLTKRQAIDKRQSQTLLLRCKTAAVLAWWDGRMRINVDDWRLAGQVVAMSGAVLRHIEQVKENLDAVGGERRAAARGTYEAITETAKERRLVAELSTRIVERVPPEGVGRRELARLMTSSTTRHRFDAALDRAVADGFLVVEDGQIMKAPT
jgi:Bifunctional DNA primase/polymerase, N-terminal